MATKVNESFRPQYLLRSGHLQTLFSVSRKLSEPVRYRKERIETLDNDFLDLNWLSNNNLKIAVLCHGLEGHSHTPYMKGMAIELKNAGWDVLAWNYRSCSKEINRTNKMYNAGETADLDRVLNHIINKKKYDQIALVGFSLGANLVLRFLYDHQSKYSNYLSACIAISCPLDLMSSSLRLSKGLSLIYTKKFLSALKKKVIKKEKQFPDQYKSIYFDQINNFIDFDTHFTAPIYGFKDATDFYRQKSSINILPRITLPTLIINSLDDPFLGEECFPLELIDSNDKISFEITKYGGHTGFIKNFNSTYSWAEKRSVSFLNKLST